MRETDFYAMTCHACGAELERAAVDADMRKAAA